MTALLLVVVAVAAALFGAGVDELAHHIADIGPRRAANRVKASLVNTGRHTTRAATRAAGGR